MNEDAFVLVYFSLLSYILIFTFLLLVRFSSGYCYGFPQRWIPIFFRYFSPDIRASHASAPFEPLDVAPSIIAIWGLANFLLSILYGFVFWRRRLRTQPNMKHLLKSAIEIRKDPLRSSFSSSSSSFCCSSASSSSSTSSSPSSSLPLIAAALPSSSNDACSGSPSRRHHCPCPCPSASPSPSLSSSLSSSFIRDQPHAGASPLPHKKSA